MNTDNLLSINQAAAFAGVTRLAINHWRKKGLKSYRIATHTFIDKTELEQFLEASKGWRREALTISRRERRDA